MATAGEQRLWAGAAAVDVTPPPGVYLAGFARGRVAEGVHDPLWARALALGNGRRTVVLVAVDCLGLLRTATAEIARRLHLRPGHLLVCATHTHSGPDTIGLWGPDPGTSGVDPAVMEQLLAGAVSAAEQALDAVRPALLTCSRAMAPVRTAVNVREPAVIDAEIGILSAADAESGRSIGTLVNWACHPEVLQDHSRTVTSDFADPLRRRIEELLGGTALFVNGALGAMVTVATADESFAEAERIGTAVGDAVHRALLASEELLETADVAVASREVRIPLEGGPLRQAVLAGPVPREAEGGEVVSEVTAWRLGPATFLAVPGEAQPHLGQRWKRMMSGRHRFVLGLANDELGYLLRPEDYHQQAYAYERSMSVGPAAAERLGEAIRAVLAAVDG